MNKVQIKKAMEEGKTVYLSCDLYEVRETKKICRAVKIIEVYPYESMFCNAAYVKYLNGMKVSYPVYYEDLHATKEEAAAQTLKHLQDYKKRTLRHIESLHRDISRVDRLIEKYFDETLDIAP